MMNEKEYMQKWFNGDIKRKALNWDIWGRYFKKKDKLRIFDFKRKSTRKNTRKK